MSIITIASSKGGPGKTTVTMILALMLTERKVPFALIDADPTLALSDWARDKCEPEIPCIIATKEDAMVDAAFEQDAKGLVVLIDTAGFDNPTTRGAITIASHVLVPVGVGASDIMQAEATARNIALFGKQQRRPIDAKALLNKQTRTRASQFVFDEAHKLSISPLSATFGQRIAYPEISLTGVLPGPRAAKDEIDAVYDELAGLGWFKIEEDE
ncbi:hypothetical protein AD951_08440 [Acetobacter malorum]|uniref:Uncharacterized protein n=1 Tax=Acetobacter malorum TaxID=178901 RepID=A0A149UMI4_9PROT|nr:ParA family protein [Acetobacter malorum]KXV69054.1 hypothetical protein AD951_08440 [Acetobacter malorum]